VARHLRIEALDVPPEFKEDFEKVAITISKPRRTVLFRRGQLGAGVFLLRTGKARLLLEKCISARVPPKIVGPGALIGLPSAIANEPRAVTAEIVEDATLAYVDRRDLVRLLRSDAQHCLWAVEVLGRRLQEAHREKARCIVPRRRRGRSKQNLRGHPRGEPDAPPSRAC